MQDLLKQVLHALVLKQFYFLINLLIKFVNHLELLAYIFYFENSTWTKKKKKEEEKNSIFF